MTHMPPQFRPPTVLIEEWRRRAAEFRTSDGAAAEVYERCASELEELDVHTEGEPAGASRTFSTGRESFRVAMGLIACGVFLAGVTALQSRASLRS